MRLSAKKWAKRAGIYQAMLRRGKIQEASAYRACFKDREFTVALNKTGQ